VPRQRTRVLRLPRIAFGAPAYWNGTAVAATAAGNLKIVVFTEAAANGLCVVKLSP
jgi:hypothetical protein